MAQPLPFQIEQECPEVLTLRLEMSAGDEQWFLLRADAHHDNKHCRHDLERQHLEQAKQRNAGILDFGDLCCAMQGRFDRRLDYDQLPDELRVSAKTYLDALVAYNADFYVPYASQFVMLSPGNHEDSILDHHQTNLTERIAERLRIAGSPVKVGRYQGWIRFLFNVCGTQRQSYNLRYTHGYGGGGPVTKDTIQANRQMVFLDGVHFLVSGHTHDSWNMTYVREGLTNNGRPYRRDVECLKLGTYKDEYSAGQGWAVKKGMPPKPLGSWWLRFFCKQGQIQYEVVRAKG
jgi:hypothetical protein